MSNTLYRNAVTFNQSHNNKNKFTVPHPWFCVFCTIIGQFVLHLTIFTSSSKAIWGRNNDSLKNPLKWSRLKNQASKGHFNLRKSDRTVTWKLFQSTVWARKNQPKPHFFITSCVFLFWPLVVTVCMVPRTQKSNFSITGDWENSRFCINFWRSDFLKGK